MIEKIINEFIKAAAKDFAVKLNLSASSHPDKHFQMHCAGIDLFYKSSDFVRHSDKWFKIVQEICYVS